jgi:hypothetical protein
METLIDAGARLVTGYLRGEADVTSGTAEPSSG